jgi:hypothetical protein
MNEVVFGWIDLGVFLAVIASCSVVAGLVCWSLDTAAIHRVKRTRRVTNVQRKAQQQILR